MDNMLNYEIERKFFIKPVFLELFSDLHFNIINQTYFIFEDCEQDYIRMRSVACMDGKPYFYQTVKIGSGLKRQELETQVDLNDYANLFSRHMAECKISASVSKVRYISGQWEIDVYGQNKVIAEIELKSEFDPLPDFPAILKDSKKYEVTNMQNFSNLSSALKGFPNYR